MSNKSTPIKWLKDSFGYLILTSPVIFFGANWMFNRNYWFNADPAAWYFLDSLAVFAGKSYVYVDHPGTPVQMIGSFILGATYPFFSNSELFIRYHLAEPETFFIMTNLFLLFMNFLTIIALYRTVIFTLKQDKVLAGIAISWMYFAVHPHSFSTLTYWSHNSFNFIFGTLWLLWLYKELQPNIHLGWIKLVSLGISVGVLTMTQLYLLPWLAGGVIIIVIFSLRIGNNFWKAFRQGLIMFGGGIFGILLMLAPIYKELPRLADWLERLITHSGLYGAGEKSVYSLNLIPLAINYWCQNVPLLMAALAFIIVTLGFYYWTSINYSDKHISSADFAFLFGLLVQTILLALILTKMFYRVRYLLSLAAILPILLVLAFKFLEGSKWSIIWMKRLVYGGLIVSAFFFIIKEIDTQNKNAIIEREAAFARSKAVARLANIQGVSKKDITVVYAWGTPIKCAGLLLANNWIRAFDDQLSEQCPNQYALYDFAYETEINPTHPIKTIEEIDWDLVIWPGNGSDLRIYLDTVDAKNVPKSWRIKRAKWFFIHQN